MSDGNGGNSNGGGPKIVSLPQQNELAAATEHLKRNLDAMIEGQKVLAKIRRSAYLAYIEEGFTQEEALTLCMK